MLVLSRKVGQKIVLGDQVTITIIASRGPRQLGITAPPGVRVVRSDWGHSNRPRRQARPNRPTLGFRTPTLLESRRRSIGSSNQPPVAAARCRPEREKGGGDDNCIESHPTFHFFGFTTGF